MLNAIFNLPELSVSIIIYYSSTSATGVTIQQHRKTLAVIDNGLEETEVILDKNKDVKIDVRLFKWAFWYKPEIRYQNKLYYGTTNGSPDPLADVTQTSYFAYILGGWSVLKSIA